MTLRRAYLDYNASAPLRPEARQAMETALALVGNPSSPHREGQRARAVVEHGRRQLAEVIDAAPREIVFTGSATEAITLAIHGVLREPHRDRDHLLISAVEHDAVRSAADALAEEGVRVSQVPVDQDGVVDLRALELLVDDRTALVAVMAANNELGILQPIRDVVRLARARGAAVLVDAVQAVGRVPLSFHELGLDLLALSSHKLGGPHGVGALAIRRGLPLRALLPGGGQEQGRRGGTENAPGIAGFARAAVIAHQQLNAGAAASTELRDRLERELLARFSQARINGRGAARVPGTSSVTIPGLDAEAAVIRMDQEGVAVSTGSACASGAAEPSHVLAAIGLDPDQARATLRFSLGWNSTVEDVDAAVLALTEAASAQGLCGEPAAATRPQATGVTR